MTTSPRARGAGGLLSAFAAGAAAPRIPEDAAEALYRRRRREMAVGLTLTYAFYYVCRLGLSVMKKPLIDEGVFTAADLGLIGAWFQYSYGFGKLAAGVLADRANVRLFVPAGLLLSAFVNAAMGANDMLWIAVALWALNGLFQGAGAPGCVVGLTQWFSGRERGTMYGVWSTAHAIGEGITFVLTSIVVAQAGWRAGFFGAAGVCVVAAIAAAIVLRDRPETEGLPPVHEHKGEPAPVHVESSTWKAQMLVLRMPAVWIVGASSALMYVTRYAINSWGVLYLQEAHGYTLAQAGQLVGLNAFAAIVGSAAYGWLSDRFFASRRPPVTLIFGIVEVASLFVIFFGEGTWVLALGFVLYGFTLSGLLAVLGGLMAVDIAPKNATGMAMGFVGVFSYLGAGVQEQISGHLIHQGTTMVDGAKHVDFSSAITFWVAASIASMLLAATLWKVQEGRTAS